MPTYELAVIVKALQRPELASAMRRTCKFILDGGGVIRKMENLGVRELPYRMAIDNQKFTTGNYFVIDFDCAPSSLSGIQDHLKRDLEIIKPSVFKKEEKFERPCQFGQCEFGELPNPDHERRVWRRRVLKHMKISTDKRDHVHVSKKK